MADEEEEQQQQQQSQQLEVEEDDDDDFSFPTTIDPPLRFIESPPLWRRRSKFPEEMEHLFDQSTKLGTNYYSYSMQSSQRKSFSYIEGRRSVRDNDSNIDDEDEKMDMLWEDLNEEFYAGKEIADSLTDRRRKRQHLIRSAAGGEKLLSYVGCVQIEKALKLSKANYNKRPSIVEFVRVLKKMFSNRNYHPPLHQ